MIPSREDIIKIKRLVSLYEEEAIFNPNFKNEGYVKYVQSRWDEDLPLDCHVNDLPWKE